VTTQVPPADRDRLCLTDQDVLGLDRTGHQIQQLLGRPHDVEWAIADGHIWILQARPITTALPARPMASPGPARAGTTFTGTPAGAGVAEGPVRVVHGPDDFDRVKPGDVLVCRTTDPAWTPVFSIAAAVVTENGGLLSHAAIIAREHGLPAVLAVPDATTARRRDRHGRWKQRARRTDLLLTTDEQPDHSERCPGWRSARGHASASPRSRAVLASAAS